MVMIKHICSPGALRQWADEKSNFVPSRPIGTADYCANNHSSLLNCKALAKFGIKVRTKWQPVQQYCRHFWLSRKLKISILPLQLLVTTKHREYV